MDKQTQTEIEAAAFRRIIKHFQTHTDVQNIDLMNLADFCRNCFSKWYVAAAEERGENIDYDAAREIVYGMAFSEWKSKYQKSATPEQLAAFEEGQKRRENASD
ncbi:MAG: deoxycytidine triphosphate deaminase [Cycloclasticus sp. symbiont of Bathymodiolus heckerae]|nr:MAG: deoxycytidine triphosphate deaminase [Cycloclasticus sp. symbiont of Bathymodiolus heckerae]